MGITSHLHVFQLEPLYCRKKQIRKLHTFCCLHSTHAMRLASCAFAAAPEALELAPFTAFGEEVVELGPGPGGCASIFDKAAGLGVCVGRALIWGL